MSIHRRQVGLESTTESRMLNIELVVPKLCTTNINIERRMLIMILALPKLSTTNRGELHTFSHRF